MRHEVSLPPGGAWRLKVGFSPLSYIQISERFVPYWRVLYTILINIYLIESVVKLYMNIWESLLNHIICSYINQNGCDWFILKFDEKVNSYHVTTLFTLFLGSVLDIIYTCINTWRKFHIHWTSNQTTENLNITNLYFFLPLGHSHLRICCILIDILPTHPNSTVIF